MSNVLIAACTLLLTTVAGAAEIRGIVVDISGTPVIDAIVVRVVGGREEPVTLASDGTFTVPAEAGEIRVRAAGFAEAVVPFTVETTELIRIVLQPASFADSIVVTADRGTSRLPSAASATVLTSAELNNAASGALDDVLRQTPGFTLFRRSTSRTANPTTQGVTLRGVSGSGASRTLVLADGVPLNDPFGSWVYWNRVPLAAIDRVEVVRGGAGDLYGADALGGVIQVLTFSPTRPRLRAAVDGGSHSTGRGSLFGGTRLGGWTATAAGEVVKTAGVITLDRAVAGPVDVKADSDYRTGFFSVGTSRERWRASLRLSGYAEDRNNGTPVQVNTTDWRQLSAEAGGLAADGRVGSARGERQPGLLPDVLCSRGRSPHRAAHHVPDDSQRLRVGRRAVVAILRAPLAAPRRRYASYRLDDRRVSVHARVRRQHAEWPVCLGWHRAQQRCLRALRVRGR